MKRWLILAATPLLLLAPRTSHAGNANSFFMGDNASLTAGTIAAWTTDSESLWYNPAGMGGNRLTRLNISGQVFLLRLQRISDGVVTTLPSGTYTQNAAGNEYEAVPTTLSYLNMASEKISWGFGVYVPQYEDISFDNSFESTEEFPGLVGKMSYAHGFDIDFLTQEYDVGAGLGWQAYPGLRFGASLFAVYQRTRYDANQSESIESADKSGAVSLFLVDAQRAIISTVGVRGALGLQWEPTTDWWLGFVLFSPTIQIGSWGNTSLIVAGSSLDPGGGAKDYADRVSTDINVWSGDMVEPFHTQVALAWVRPSFVIGATADFYVPLQNTTLLVDKVFTWNLAVGGKFKASDKIELGAGLFTDRSQDPEPVVFATGRVNYYGVAAGAEFRTHVSRGVGVEPFTFGTTLALRYALGTGDAGGETFNQTTDEDMGMAKVMPVSVLFNEISLYVGTSLFF